MKKILAFVLALVVIASLFTGCGKAKESDLPETPEIAIADLVKLPDPEYDYLFYSAKTGTVYYLFIHGSMQYETGFMSPYIMNGHTCQYKNGKIVEVIP